MFLLYSICCFFWALHIREIKNFEHLMVAFFASLSVTPVFANRVYEWIEEGDIQEAKQQKEHEKFILEDNRRRFEELKKRKTPRDVLREAIAFRNELEEDDIQRKKELDRLIEKLKTMSDWDS